MVFKFKLSRRLAISRGRLMVAATGCTAGTFIDPTVEPAGIIIQPRDISLEISLTVGAVVVGWTPAAQKRRNRPGVEVPPGCLTGARPHWGSTGTCETLASPPVEYPEGSG